jgi:hypothetical protein
MEKEKEKEYLVTLVMKEVAIPLGYYSKEVADAMKKEIQFQIDSSIGKYVESFIVK